ncbi:serine hydrolase domain-containing protein [Actinoplanes subtropicus]|uniref:serine hydrolase domain-containing protein n=1 Tax=Actinoplanes subtropicus TaxID=543632 RepID=UPI000553A252|nr:serine hydrolase domain-containing protein [Actinoplanes subtropicus]
MRTKAAVAAILAGALIAGGVAPAAQAAGRPDQRRLQTAVDDLHAIGITGVQGLTGAGGRTTTARSGVANLDTGAPVPRNGYFRMGSDTKTFVSVVLLQLVGERRLSLDDPVQRWLPGVVSGNGNDGAKVTVRELLQHTSGIANYTGDLTALGSPAAYYAHRFDHYDPADLVALAMKHPPLFAPGTSWSYSNTNYILAGMIIQKVTGHSWAREVHDRVLAPLHLSQTYVPGDNPTLRDPHAEGYNQFAPGGPLIDTTLFNPTAADAAGSMVSTPSDLARFWQALQTGRLLRPAQMAQMHDTVPAPGLADPFPGARYGLGIMWIDDSCGGYWSHAGDVPGMSTLNAVSPDGRRVVVLSLTTELADPAGELAVYRRAHQLIDDTFCADRSR